MWVCEFILAGIPSHADFALSQDTSGQKVLLQFSYFSHQLRLGVGQRENYMCYSALLSQN